jgi:hypothetical protein
MPTVQQWGRRESIIWPPRGYLYTLGAFFLACVATGFFIYLRFQFGLQPLQRYYLAVPSNSCKRPECTPPSSMRLSVRKTLR